MPAEVKICGLSSLHALDAALDAGADLVGLVFYPRSPRHVTTEAAAELARRARGRARIVALTVDAPDPLIVEIAAKVHPDLYQAHGRESPERVAAIAQLTGKPVIKSVSVSCAEDLSRAGAYSESASFILFDAKPSRAPEALPGGNGATFDWHILAGRSHRLPFLLAGGLTPENVAEAISVTKAPIVDVSSGVESAPGVKDPGLIRSFIAAAKAAR